MAMWTHGYLSYTLVILQYYFMDFVSQIVPALATWVLVLFVPVTLWCTLIIVNLCIYFLTTFLLPGTQRCSRSSCLFPAQHLESAVSEGHLILFTGEWLGNKTSVLGVCVHCSWGMFLGPLNWRSKGQVYVYNMYTNACVCTYLWYFYI